MSDFIFYEPTSKMSTKIKHLLVSVLLENNKPINKIPFDYTINHKMK